MLDAEIYDCKVIHAEIEDGVKGEKGDKGPPVPLAQELGDDPNLAVSQKLLKDSIDSMEQSNADAVAEAERLNNFSQQAASSAAESESSASTSAESANSSSLSAAQSASESASSAEQSLQSASSSESSAQSASSSAQSASESASSAGVSAEQAVLYAAAADDSAGKAKQSELAALNSAESSEASANSASSSATQAGQSAQSAASSAQSAADSESSASSSKDAAEASAQSASDSADRAEQAATLVEDKLDKSAVKDELGDSLEFVINQRRVTQELMNIIAWIDIPKQPMMADFTKQRYALNGKPCRFEDIFEFIRLSSATMWQDGQLVEVANNVPRINSEGLLIEPQRTNSLLNSITVNFNSNNTTMSPVVRSTTPEGFHRYSPQSPSTYLTMYGAATGLAGKVKTAYLQPSRVGIRCSITPYTSSFHLLPLAPTRFEGGKEADRFEGLYTDPKETMSESDYIQAMYGQAEDSDYATSWIRTTTAPATRSPDILNIPLLPSQTITGDWDNGVTYTVADGIATFTGHGYIRNITVEAL